MEAEENPALRRRTISPDGKIAIQDPNGGTGASGKRRENAVSTNPKVLGAGKPTALPEVQSPFTASHLYAFGSTSHAK
jgi:hypothetical protein